MRRIWLTAGLLSLIGVFALGAIAIAGGGGKGHGFKAFLSGYQETPSISSPATGRFKAKINGNQINYRISYSGFTSTVTAAHIHFAQPGVAGGILAFLCGGGTPPKPACPQSGEVSGTITADDIAGLPAQGIAPHDIGAVIAAMRAGFTYANVHTANFMNGEIRGQIGGKRFGFGKFGKHAGFGDDEGDHGNNDDQGRHGKGNDD